MLEDIERKKALLDSKRPLPEYTVKSIREQLLLEWTYNSNAIEGNTLTLMETIEISKSLSLVPNIFHQNHILLKKIWKA